MAYELSLEREPALTIEEWRCVVEASPLLRCGSIDTISTNPKTGESIAVRGAEGDAAIELDGRWVNVFRWRKGRVTFNARDIENSNDLVSKVAFSLARALGAIVRGEEGETYGPVV
ncbi:hypothetical protein [Dyella subtropica]|uniref:hypothetical protein n=1 Tax=Dyella subtropica TaxID=2992127 RepID=UPI00224E7755|nr:hypothetical protein [Dyella subtropica]